MRKQLLISLMFLAVLGFAASASAQQTSGKKENKDELQSQVTELKIPKPEFNVASYLRVEGMWHWDDKDPRFYSSFVKKIIKSLDEGPF